MAAREHGTRAKYVADRCRCEPCRTANRQAENHRYRQQAYGRWQPYVDARPARAHVRMLMEYGLGWKRIADLAGVGRGTVEKLLYGAAHRGMEPSKRVRPETATRLLAVRPVGERLGGAVLVDATGTSRRLRALVAAGWPQAQLAARLGVQAGNFGKSLRSEQVLAATERAVRKLYDELWRADPREHGVTEQAYRRARNHARSHGWAPVGAWDDDTIDDPASEPWTESPGTGRRSKNELGAIRREEIAHLIQFGLSEQAIAQRLDMSQSSVRNIVAELRGETPAAVARTQRTRRPKQMPHPTAPERSAA
ncbi:hypothetical protein [Streptomyces sp. Da 82-17]|uniref:hypothetical protein n=1 Tax=Streptomyces sp. Da 82-17 TaxID=3377116 RepID=UPI0038D43AA2